MTRLLTLSLASCAFLTNSAAQAQIPDQAETLRDQIAAMEAQLAALSNRLDQIQARPAQGDATTGAAASASFPRATEPEMPGVETAFGGAPELSSEDGWSFKPFGRIQADAGVVELPDGLRLEEGFGSELRRVRIGAGGDIPGGFGYKIEGDFAGGETELTDAIITYDHGDLTLTAGQHNNFQSLEELTSSRFSSFIERAAFTDAFGFERRLGLSAQYGSGDILLQAGLFSDNAADLPGKNWSFDARAVYMPMIGDTQLHVGGSLHRADQEADDVLRYRQRPLVHFTSERLIDTGSFVVESEFGAGLELAAISGPLHFAGETYWNSVDRPGAVSDPTFFGGYAEIGYFLTQGDSRGYKGGKFDRTRPAAPLGEGGIGAVQLNLRYDYLDLADEGFAGGRQNGYLASLVWVPTDYTRLMLNYGWLAYDDAPRPLPTGERSYDAHVVGARAQVDF